MPMNDISANHFDLSVHEFNTLISVSALTTVTCLQPLNFSTHCHTCHVFCNLKTNASEVNEH